jgi:hypothetical protein
MCHEGACVVGSDGKSTFFFADVQVLLGGKIAIGCFCAVPVMGNRQGGAAFPDGGTKKTAPVGVRLFLIVS